MRLTIANRHVERAQQLARWLKRHRPRTHVQVASLRTVSVRDCALLVNATSVGMRAGDPSPVSLAGCSKRLMVYDLVYHHTTALVRQARRRGCVADNGVSMLLYQGAEAFRLWWRRRPPIAAMRRALQQRSIVDSP
jgi:shikimate dehydrogenase